MSTSPASVVDTIPAPPEFEDVEGPCEGCGGQGSYDEYEPNTGRKFLFDEDTTCRDCGGSGKQIISPDYL